MPNLALPSDALTGHSGGLGTSVAIVIQVDATNWRCTLRDITHSEVQPIGALVIGSVLPPVHDPANGIHSYVHYGFFGGRRMDSWCVPAVFSDMTDDERKDNQFFMRLLGVTIRIGKDPDSDDVVYEVAGGDAVVRVNITTGKVEVIGADGTASVVILASGKITVDAKGAMTVEVSDGSGGTVALALNSDLNDLVAKYDAATYPVPGGGSTLTTSQPATPYTGTTVLKAK